MAGTRDEELPSFGKLVYGVSHKSLHTAGSQEMFETAKPPGTNSSPRHSTIGSNIAGLEAQLEQRYVWPDDQSPKEINRPSAPIIGMKAPKHRRLAMAPSRLPVIQIPIHCGRPQRYPMSPPWTPSPYNNFQSFVGPKSTSDSLNAPFTVQCSSTPRILIEKEGMKDNLTAGVIATTPTTVIEKEASTTVSDSFLEKQKQDLAAMGLTTVPRSHGSILREKRRSRDSAERSGHKRQRLNVAVADMTREVEPNVQNSVTSSSSSRDKPVSPVPISPAESSVPLSTPSAEHTATPSAARMNASDIDNTPQASMINAIAAFDHAVAQSAEAERQQTEERVKSMAEVETIKNVCAELRKDRDIANGTIERLQTVVNVELDKTKEMNRLKKEYEKMEQAKAEQQAEVEKLRGEIEAHTNKEEMQAKVQAEQEKKMERLQTEVKELTALRDNTGAAKEQLLIHQITRLKRDLDTKSWQLEGANARLEEEQETHAQDLQDLQREIAALRVSVDEAETSAHATDTQNFDLRDKVSKYEARIVTLQDERTELVLEDRAQRLRSSQLLHRGRKLFFSNQVWRKQVVDARDRLAGVVHAVANITAATTARELVVMCRPVATVHDGLNAALETRKVIVSPVDVVTPADSSSGSAEKGCAEGQ